MREVEDEIIIVTTSFAYIGKVGIRHGVFQRGGGALRCPSRSDAVFYTYSGASTYN